MTRGTGTLDDFEAIFNAAPDACAIVDASGVIRVVNPKVEAMFGWSADELVGQPVEVLLPDALREAHEHHRAEYMERPRARPMGVGLELRARRRDGSEFPVEISLSPWQNVEEKPRIICSIRDVSSYRRLQTFSEGALRATEDERKRIARELHDDTAQRIATLILRVGRLARESDDRRRARLFHEVRNELVEAAESVKRLSRGLRPPEIEELGLELALRAHVRTLQESGVFRVDARIGRVDPYLDANAKLALYRIVQEALSNARRHSGADSARLRVGYERGAVVAEVSDTGSGFDAARETDDGRGLGLIGMQERALMIGGTISVDSERGSGTRVFLLVPVDAERSDG